MGLPFSSNSTVMQARVYRASRPAPAAARRV
jgi:hypothetical protein